MYALHSYPDCFVGYHGRHQNVDVFVVGLGTETERLFQKRDASEAIAYAKGGGGKLHRFTAVSLCSDAMYELFGE